VNRSLPLAAAGLLLGACHGALGPDAPDDLAGLKAVLLPGASLRWAIAGTVDGRAAAIDFDFASPLTTVTQGCFDDIPESGGRVRFPLARGGTAVLPEVLLRQARVGALRIGARRVGLDVSETQNCEVVLGTDVLAGYAAHLDPLTRELSLSHPKPRSWYVAQVGEAGETSTDEVHLVELARDPTADWPVLTLKLEQPRAQLVGPFILSTREPHSTVSDSAAQRAGLKPGPDLLKDLEVAQDLASAPSLLTPGYPLNGIELAPGFGVKWGGVAADAQWKNPGAVGQLGSDVWGRFRLTLDLHAGVLLLERPRVFASGDKQRCATTAGPSEEACFQLNSSQVAGQPVSVVGIVWRDLPEGARVYLEPRGADGAPLQLPCRVGLTFEQSERGVSTEHGLPWEGLQKDMPACAAEMHKVASYALELVEEGSLEDCPGECAFVRELLTRRVRCECAPQIWGGGTRAEQDYLKMYRQMLDRVRGSSPKEPEPED
jgi:hypothetical protein